MRRSASPALFAAAAELVLLRCTDGPVPLVEALGASAAWVAVGVAVARLDRRLAALPVALLAAGVPIWRDGGPAEASPIVWMGAAALAVGALAAAGRGAATWAALVAASLLLTVLATPAALPAALPAGAAAVGFVLLAMVRPPVVAWALALLASQAPRSLHDPHPPRWSTSAQADGPDIVLVVVDTLRADAGRATQAYARLTERGRTFASATAAGPWTLPSMAALLTAQPFDRHGAGARPDGPPTAISSAVPTVAERLTEAGYDTAAVVAPNPWLGAQYGFRRGFAVWEHAGAPPESALPANPAVPGAHPLPVLALYTARGLLGRAAPSTSPPTSDRLVDRALELLQARRDRPVFLWVHLLDPHLPWTDLPTLRLADLRADPQWRTPEGLERARAAYQADVDRADRAVQRLLDGLGPAPPRGRVVVLTSDHGEELLDHGGFEHGHTLYQELLDVPLVISGAGVVPGSEPVPVGLDDVGATLLAAAGLPASADLRRPARAKPIRSGNLLGGHPGQGVAIRDGDTKRIHLPDTHARYDLARDPRERHPLPADALAAPTPVVGPDAAADRDGLEALGYLDR